MIISLKEKNEVWIEKQARLKDMAKLWITGPATHFRIIEKQNLLTNFSVSFLMWVVVAE